MQNRFPVKLQFILVAMIFNGFSLSYAGAMDSGATRPQMNGAKIWSDNCARCHNYRSATEFTPNQWTTIMMHMRIQGGLTGQEARAVTDFLTQASLAEFKTVTAPGSTTVATSTNQSETSKGSTTTLASSGKAIYQNTCIACHGANGKGIAPSFPDFTKKGGVLSKSSTVLLNNIKHGIGAMPAKGGNSALTDQDLQAVLSYIKNTFAK